ncbi:hypothetical protein TNCV_3891501 [Trichonephila clavipes]|nr:hypothetical protein TNCV_3891501 [Trichonephila clavipes]
MAAVAEWYRYRIVACLVTSSSTVPQMTRRVGQRYTLNLSRAETSSHWCVRGNLKATGTDFEILKNDQLTRTTSEVTLPAPTKDV